MLNHKILQVFENIRLQVYSGEFHHWHHQFFPPIFAMKKRLRTGYCHCFFWVQKLSPVRHSDCHPTVHCSYALLIAAFPFVRQLDVNRGGKCNHSAGCHLTCSTSHRQAWFKPICIHQVLEIVAVVSGVGASFVFLSSWQKRSIHRADRRYLGMSRVSWPLVWTQIDCHDLFRYYVAIVTRGTLFSSGRCTFHHGVCVTNNSLGIIHWTRPCHKATTIGTTGNMM